MVIICTLQYSNITENVVFMDVKQIITQLRSIIVCLHFLVMKVSINNGLVIRKTQCIDQNEKLVHNVLHEI